MKKLIMASITAVVVVAVLAGTLMPILDDATATSDTFTNLGRYYIDTEIGDDVTIAMEYDNTNNVRTWTIDGDLLTYNEVDGVEYVQAPTVVGTDNWVFRADGRTRGLNSSTGSTSYSVSVTSSAITSGALSGNAPLFVASTTETDSVMRYGLDTDVYLNADSTLIGCGSTDITYGEDLVTPIVIAITGNIEDGVEVSAYHKTLEGLAVSNIEINAEKDNDYTDLYKFDDITFDVTYNDGENDYVTHCSYSVIVVPAEVTSERSVHFTDGENAIFNAIPVMIIIALLLGVVALVLRSRMD